MSKAYQALERDGLVRSYPGRGIAVLSRGRRGTTGRSGLSDIVTSVVTEAALAGISREQLLEHVQETVLTVYRDALVPIAFIECTERESTLLSEELRQRLGMAVTPLVLADLDRLRQETGRFTIISTTYRHLQEVSSALKDSGMEVVGVHYFVAPESMLELARLAPGLRAAVVAPNESSLTWMKNVVETYGRARIVGLVGEEQAALRDALAGADVAIGTSLTADAIRAVRPDVPIVVVEFHLDSQSLTHLRDRVGAHARQTLVREGATSRARILLREADKAAAAGSIVGRVPEARGATYRRK